MNGAGDGRMDVELEAGDGAVGDLLELAGLGRLVGGVLVDDEIGGEVLELLEGGIGGESGPRDREHGADEYGGRDDDSPAAGSRRTRAAHRRPRGRDRTVDTVRSPPR
ncbi:MAG: hypothetical protein ABEN55_02000 [Bradymonadaceae bacterium]